MSSDLNRFGVAMDRLLLKQFDAIVRERQSTRSAVLSDLARAEVTRDLVNKPVQAVGTLAIIYDHHVRDLAERLTEMQHELGDQVHSTMHVHLEHDRCLEVIVLRGRADRLRSAADRLIATRGVLHGSLELFADARENAGAVQPARDGLHAHPHRTNPHPHSPSAASGNGRNSALATRRKSGSTRR